MGDSAGENVAPAPVVTNENAVPALNGQAMPSAVVVPDVQDAVNKPDVVVGAASLDYEVKSWRYAKCDRLQPWYFAL